MYNETDLYLFAFISSLHSLSCLISLIPSLLCLNKSPTPSTKAWVPSLSSTQRCCRSTLTQITSAQAQPRIAARQPGATRPKAACMGFCRSGDMRGRPEQQTGSNSSSEGPVPEIVSACYLINRSRWETVAAQRFLHAVALQSGINTRALLGTALITLSFTSAVLSLLQFRFDGFAMSGRQNGKRNRKSPIDPPPPTPPSVLSS